MLGVRFSDPLDLKRALQIRCLVVRASMRRWRRPLTAIDVEIHTAFPFGTTGSVIYFTFDALKIMVSSQADCGRLPSLGRQGIGRVSPSVARASSSPLELEGRPMELGLRDAGGDDLLR